MTKRIFLICPVRDISEGERAFTDFYIDQLETGDLYKIHYPPRDTDQIDPIGLRICSDNRVAIRRSNAVHIFYSTKSNGSMFDLGMTFANKKNLLTVNPEKISETENYISEFLSNYSINLDRNNSKDFQKMLERRDEIKQLNLIEYDFKERTPEFLFDFGMAFMMQKPISLLNRKDVQKTPHKSFENVLLELDKKEALTNLVMQGKLTCSNPHHKKKGPIKLKTFKRKNCWDGWHGRDYCKYLIIDDKDYV